ncbi:hypothetical protein [Microvirga subterranea]|uniref:Uncharacterized protein n=1 Tax=Microvirga subterranea TaxID=186651 RepID=A0A370HJ04_9HYPH|nr:hypothetical protein [Microvirga subterranea]RDI58572.1 hypothetical protein DES45_10595 [Microvirga subterranea]
MKHTQLRLPCVTLHSPHAGTSVRVAECELTRVVAAASRWRDLKDLLRLDLLSHAGGYLLAGRDLATQQRCLRVGEVSELRRRLRDGRWDAYLRPEDEVFVLTATGCVLTRADVLHWRERLCGLAWSAGRVRVVRGRADGDIAPPPARREMLDLLLADGLPLLCAAGCRWLAPRSSQTRRAA